MFKRFIILLLAFVLLCSIPVSAAETSTADNPPSLSFDGSTATCYYKYVSFGSDIEVTLELRRNGSLVASWPASGTSIVIINEECTVVRGATYTLVAKGTCDGAAFTSSTVTGTCP